jgi:hypothetical protein
MASSPGSTDMTGVGISRREGGGGGTLECLAELEYLLEAKSGRGGGGIEERRSGLGDESDSLPANQDCSLLGEE